MIIIVGCRYVFWVKARFVGHTRVTFSKYMKARQGLPKAKTYRHTDRMNRDVPCFITSASVEPLFVATKRRELRTAKYQYISIRILDYNTGIARYIQQKSRICFFMVRMKCCYFNSFPCPNKNNLFIISNPPVM